MSMNKCVYGTRERERESERETEREKCSHGKRFEDGSKNVQEGRCRRTVALYKAKRHGKFTPAERSLRLRAGNLIMTTFRSSFAAIAAAMLELQSLHLLGQRSCLFCHDSALLL